MEAINALEEVKQRNGSHPTLAAALQRLEVDPSSRPKPSEASQMTEAEHHALELAQKRARLPKNLRLEAEKSDEALLKRHKTCPHWP